MNARRKRFLIYFLLCLAPLLFLVLLNYLIASKLSTRATGDGLQESINGLAVALDEDLRNEAAELRRLASSTPIKQFIESKQGLVPNGTVNPASAAQSFSDLQLAFKSLLHRNGKVFRVILFGSNRLLLQAAYAKESPEVIEIKTENLPDERLSPNTLDDDEFTRVPNTTTLRFATPVAAQGSTVSSVLVGEANLTELLPDAMRRLTTETSNPTPVLMSVVWDGDGKLLYHPNALKRGTQVGELLPQSVLSSGATSGITRFQTASGRDYLFAYSPLPRLGVTVGLARDTSDLTASVRKWSIASLAFALFLALVSGFLLEAFVHRKTSGLERVTKGLTAVAHGQLDHRVELASSDEARPVAEDLHALTERLRGQLAREAEIQQFESFFRLSAMLTHDLKNAIEALSLTVGNMQRHFDNEQFRVDAMHSLTGATNRLKALVARLSRPVTSLSGEHKRPSRVDLVPILKRALSATVEPMRDRHQIDVKLPPELFAVTDERRLEEVFENLLLNAVEAMTDRKGKLTVEAESLPGESVVKITDTGCGMSQSFIKNSLFHPFKTTKKKGIGLGLYTCREVVRASAGRIEVQSTEGFGTTFRVVLPSGT